MLTAQRIAEALQARSLGPGRWISRCPAHDDRSPSLSIREAHDGRVLVHCFAGCTQEAVIDALKARGLWPERTRDPRAPARMTRPAESEPRPLPPDTQLQALDELLADAEYVPADAPYIILGTILEHAADISYHVVARCADTLCERSDHAARQVSRWMRERYPHALFEPRVGAART